MSDNEKLNKKAIKYVKIVLSTISNLNWLDIIIGNTHFQNIILSRLLFHNNYEN